MNDYLATFEQYKDVKEIADLIDEVKKLRLYYSTRQYDAMYKHIRSLTAKYLVETLAWNTSHTILHPSKVLRNLEEERIYRSCLASLVKFYTLKPVF